MAPRDAARLYIDAWKVDDFLNIVVNDVGNESVSSDSSTQSKVM